MPGLELRLGSLGSGDARADYRRDLIAHLRRHEGELADDVRERIDENPLRAFDSKHQPTRDVMAEAPTMLDALGSEDAEHLATVPRLLDQAGLDYRLDGTLVRGLDYYTRTVFEFHCGGLGAQSQVAGGGRYDDLVELVGGPPTPAADGPPGLSGSCSRSMPNHRRPGPKCSSRPPTGSGSAHSHSPPSFVTQACGRSSTSAGAA